MRVSVRSRSSCSGIMHHTCPSARLSHLSRSSTDTRPNATANSKLCSCALGRRAHSPRPKHTPISMHNNNNLMSTWRTTSSGGAVPCLIWMPTAYVTDHGMYCRWAGPHWIWRHATRSHQQRRVANCASALKAMQCWDAGSEAGLVAHSGQHWGPALGESSTPCT